MKSVKLVFENELNKEEMSEILKLAKKLNGKALESDDWIICSSDNIILRYCSESKIESLLYKYSNIDKGVYAVKYYPDYQVGGRSPVGYEFKGIFDNNDKLYYLDYDEDGECFLSYRIRTKNGIETVSSKKEKSKKLPRYLYRFCYIYLVEGGPRKGYSYGYEAWDSQEFKDAKNTKYKFIKINKDQLIVMEEGKVIPSSIQAKFYKEYGELLEKQFQKNRNREEVIKYQLEEMRDSH